MSNITKKEIKEGKKVLGGVIILLWAAGVLAWLGLMSPNFFGAIHRGISGSWLIDKLPVSPGGFSVLIPALYVASLVGLYIRKGWAVPVTRAAIVVTMVIFFPVGTIFGAIVWKRINDPAAKKYLSYGSEDSDEEDDGEEDSDTKTTEKKKENSSKS